jgi:signal transduction histidine kinase
MVMPRGVLDRLFGSNRYVQALEQRSARLEQSQALQRAITQIVVRSTDLALALPQIIQAICETTHWELGEVWRIEADVLVCETRWHNPRHSFPAFEQASHDIRFEIGQGLPGRVWASGKPIWVTNVVDDGAFVRAPYAKQDGLHGAFCVPIRTDGEVIGVMSFFTRVPRPIDHELLRVLETVGSQIGLFIERKRLETIEREQARAITILEERRRLACDLHDSVTQTLFSASVIAEMLPLLWERDPAQVRPGLDELATLTRGALSEMRSMLVEMRAETQAERDLPTLLHCLTESFHARNHIQTTLKIEEIGDLPTSVQRALYRVVQEALNNVVKHAKATQVHIELLQRKRQLVMQIRDNGRGFDPACIPAGHLGLGIMHERAEQIGATVQISSNPGHGTTITLLYPMK